MDHNRDQIPSVSLPLPLSILPVSAVIPTRNRPGPLARTLDSLSQQCVLPAEIIIVEGSDVEFAHEVARVCRQCEPFGSTLELVPAGALGAAAQRNQGVTLASQPFIWFMDDDILFDPECVLHLWCAMQSDLQLGGVSAMITNQKYHPPGLVSRTMFTLMHGRWEASFAGRVVGPAVNLLPEDREDLPEVVPVEWLNTTCAMYRREALPSPPFDSVFTGYSMMEDLTLSLRVGKNWKLANARTARIFHDSQPGSHKSDPAELARMELVNRYYVMTRILERNRVRDYLGLGLWELFQLVVCTLRPETRSQVVRKMQGQWSGISQIRKRRS